MKTYFNDKLVHEAIKHAKEEYPYESCGLIINDEYIRCENVYEDKSKGFKLDKYIIKEAYQSDNFQAVIHSHCDTERPWASAEDIIRQEKTGVPWGIVDLFRGGVRSTFFWGDQLPIQDLLGRPFIHGVYDCFGLVRDYYRLHGHTIPNYPRDWGWWKNGENVILDNIKSSKFVLIPREKIQAGDLIIGKVKYKNPNHTGIYLGNGLILHHWAGQNSLSCEIPYNTLSKYITHVARLVDD